MIVDIPNCEDFEFSGVTFLNLAWDPILELLFTLENSEMEDWDTEGEVSEEYWQSAQKPLITSLALAQQGTELLLKGKIAQTSPFLLISGGPNNWPKGCDKKDISFVDFRTIDSQDLIRAHNTVADNRLSEEFITKFENLRRVRNRIMHTVDKKLRTSPKEIMLSILDIFESLVEPQGWICSRRNYLENQPSSAVYSSDHVEGVLAKELLHVLALFDKSSVQKHFGFNTKQRSYHCPNCDSQTGDFCEDTMLAQLKPNKPTSTSVHCLLCSEDREVLRTSCNASGCKSNVIDVEENICLFCLHEQEKV